MIDFDIFGHPEFDSHERVVFIRDEAVGLEALVAIHSFGPRGDSAGGTRMWPYTSSADALRDVLRLSKAMSYKFALAGVPVGGAKSVIIADPAKDKRPKLLKAFGAAIDQLAGLYYCAPDVGTTSQDMEVINTVTPYVRGLPDQSGDTGPATAWGVYQAMLGALEHRRGSASFEGCTVAVQGLGSVGYDLCEFIHGAGGKLIVADIDAEQSARAAREFDAETVSSDEILYVDADVLAPCALGGVLDENNASRIAADIVCGGANNQLETDATAEMLYRRGVLYVPDFVANAGGVMNAIPEARGEAYDKEVVFQVVERIREKTKEICERAERRAISPHAAAVEMADVAIAKRRVSARPQTSAAAF